MNALHFSHPDLLSWLPVIFVVTVVLLWWSFRVRMQVRDEWAEQNELSDRFNKPFNKRLEAVKAVLKLTTIVGVILAASGPVLENSPVTVRQGSMELINVLDVSNSMAAEDYRAVMPAKDKLDDNGKIVEHVPPMEVVGPYGSRLDMAKYVIRTQILPQLNRNKVGIVNYTGEGFVQYDLTTDYGAVDWVFEHWMRIGQAPGGGSDYASGLRVALNLFKDEGTDGKEKVILLWTDGGFTGNPQDLQKVLADLNQAGVRIIIVGLGSSNPTPIRLYSTEGQFTGYFQKDGQVVTTAIDEASCQTLKSLTGGEYIRLDPENPKLDITWSKAFGASQVEKHEDPAFQYPLGAAILAALGLLALGIARRRRQL
jgi:hypothetical protein